MKALTHSHPQGALRTLFSSPQGKSVNDCCEFELEMWRFGVDWTLLNVINAAMMFSGLESCTGLLMVRFSQPSAFTITGSMIKVAEVPIYCYWEHQERIDQCVFKPAAVENKWPAGPHSASLRPKVRFSFHLSVIWNWCLKLLQKPVLLLICKRKKASSVWCPLEQNCACR